MKLFGLHITDTIQQPNSMQSWIVRAENEAMAKKIVSSAPSVVANPKILKIVEVEQRYWRLEMVLEGEARQII